MQQQHHSHAAVSESPAAYDPAHDSRPQPLTLLEGQCASLALHLENVGAFPVDHVSVDVQCENTLLAKYSQDAHPLVHFTGARGGVPCAID